MQGGGEESGSDGRGGAAVGGGWGLGGLRYLLTWMEQEAQMVSDNVVNPCAT